MDSHDCHLFQKRLHRIIIKKKIISLKKKKDDNLENIINNLRSIETDLQTYYKEYERLPKKKLKSMIQMEIENIFNTYPTFLISMKKQISLNNENINFISKAEETKQNQNQNQNQNQTNIYKNGKETEKEKEKEKNNITDKYKKNNSKENELQLQHTFAKNEHIKNKGEICIDKIVGNFRNGKNMKDEEKKEKKEGNKNIKLNEYNKKTDLEKRDRNGEKMKNYLVIDSLKDMVEKQKKRKKEKEKEKENEKEQELENSYRNSNRNKNNNSNRNKILRNKSFGLKKQVERFVTALSKETEEESLEQATKELLSFINYRIEKKVNDVLMENNSSKKTTESIMMNNSSNIKEKITTLQSDLNLNEYKGINNIKKDILYSIVYPYKYSSSIYINTLININGASGSGKTTLSYAIAGECKCNFFYIRLPEYIKYLSYDIKENKLETMFKTIKTQYKKGIVCIDDIDFLFSSKEENVDIYLFTYLLDIFNNTNIIVLLLSINIPYESILYRKIHKYISIPIPTYEDRLEIFEKVETDCDIHFDIPCAASNTYGFNRGQIFDLAKELLNLYTYNEVNMNKLQEEKVLSYNEEQTIHEKNDNQKDIKEITKKSQTENLTTVLNKNKNEVRTEKYVKQQTIKQFENKNQNKNGETDIKEEIEMIEGTTGQIEKQIEMKNEKQVEMKGDIQSDLQNDIPNDIPNDIQSDIQSDIDDETLGQEEDEHLMKTKDTYVAGWKRKETCCGKVIKDEENQKKKRQKRNVYISQDIVYEGIKNMKKKITTKNLCDVPNISLDNIGALNKIKKSLESKFILPVKYATIYKHLGVHKSMGILLYGPPGCGKTMLAKAISNEMKANFIAIKGPEILNKYVGESEKKVREIFACASLYKPCLIFFDEIDSICTNRTGDKNSQASERVVNQLLSEMDGLTQRENVYIIATTNRPEIIDNALLRSGRFDQLIYVPLPTYQGRIDILRKLSKNMPIDKNVDFAKIAKKTKGYSGADLSGVLRESAFIALQKCKKKFDHFDKIATSQSNIDICSGIYEKRTNPIKSKHEHTLSNVTSLKNSLPVVAGESGEITRKQNDENDALYVTTTISDSKYKRKEHEQVGKEIMMTNNNKEQENGFINQTGNSSNADKKSDREEKEEEKERGEGREAKKGVGKFRTFVEKEEDDILKRFNSVTKMGNCKKEMDEKDLNNLIYEFIQKNKHILHIEEKHILAAIKVIPKSVTKAQIQHYKKICQNYK